MQRPYMPLATFLAMVLVCMPFVVQRTLLRRQHLPYISIALWLLLANLICGVNSLVWADNVTVRVPIWCDIGVFTDRFPGSKIAEMTDG
jgi:pheromone a factor receptor